MNKARLEAFSDGVIAIIITIMVLELKAPHERRLARARPLLPVFLTLCAELCLSSASTGTTIITCCTRRTGSTAAILWANLHLLFWLSLIPFVTGWMGENHFARCRRRSTASSC